MIIHPRWAGGFVVLAALAGCDPGPLAAEDGGSADAAVHDAGERDAGMLMDDAGPPIDPRGVYHHRFTGAATGSEWFQVVALEGPGRYVMADLSGAGAYTGTVTPTGEIMLGTPTNGAVGSFASADNFSLHFVVGTAEFESEISRAPRTTTLFPLSPFTPLAADPTLAGQWVASAVRLDGETGLSIEVQSPTVEISVAESSIELAIESIGRFTGVLQDALTLGFRVIEPAPRDVTLRSFAGSATSLDQDVLGVARIVDVNHIESTLLFQTRAALGAQEQTLWHLSIERAEPRAAGDVDADGDVDVDDRALVVGLVGITSQMASFRVAADLVRDDVVDALDVARIDAIVAAP